MGIALTPMEFARRTRRIYPDRVAVAEGEQRRNCAQFLPRAIAWPASCRTRTRSSNASTG